jgi:RNA polymerase sigma-70 factor (ECF subfamily)
MPPDMDAESLAWVTDLSSEGSVKQAALARLHSLLLRVARAESARRRARLPRQTIEELDDLCLQAANDALMAITEKLGEFRGAARFTTWACKFAMFEISTKLRRSAWRGKKTDIDDAGWETIPDRSPQALGLMLGAELEATLKRAMEQALTPAQRQIFQAAAIDEIPIDVLAERSQRSRGAIYKMLHDARRKLRQALVAAGHGEPVS